MTNGVGNLKPGEIYPDDPAPIVRAGADGRLELVPARWGLTSSRKVILDKASRRAGRRRAKGAIIDDAGFFELLRMEPDGGTTNLRPIPPAPRDPDPRTPPVAAPGIQPVQDSRWTRSRCRDGR